MASSIIRERIHLKRNTLTHTSIGLRNVTETSTGPTSNVKMVRVGVMNDPVTFDWLERASCPKIECVTPSIRSKAVRPDN
jgi:hypothetical protein